MKKEAGNASPSLLISILGLIAIIGMIVVGIKLNFGTQMAVFCGAVVAVIVAMLLGEKWSDIQGLLVEQIDGVTVANIIIIEVGILVGIWIIGGALPTLIHFGLGVISPSARSPRYAPVPLMAVRLPWGWLCWVLD